MRHEFVEDIPREVQPDTVYVSMEDAVAVHSCFCGCGGRVVTPLSRAAWELTFDGDSISLFPSVGNWQLECKSHYWICRGRVIWEERWSDEQIETGRRREFLKREAYYRNRRLEYTDADTQREDAAPPAGVWSKIKRRLPKW